MQETIGATPKARIAYVGGGSDSFKALTLAFEHACYTLVSHEDASRTDIGLIDLRGRNVSSKKAQSIAGLLRKSSPECSIIIIIDPYIDETARKALRRHGELVTMLAKPEGLIERCKQILRMRNIAEEAGERLKSLASLNRLNDFPPISAPSLPMRILIAGEAGPTALTALNALKPITKECVCVFSAGQALRAINSSRFDSAIFLPKRDNDPLMSLARALRRHPKHANMPIIFPLHDPDKAADYAARGASDFLLSGHIQSDLGPKTQITARRARLLKTMRRFLQACEGDNIRDPSSGAFTATFLAEHGARLCARADQTGRRLSLVALQMNAISKANDEIESDHRALHQATRLINRVTRAEDLVAKIAADTFIVLMSATTEQNAEKAALRIQGVLENTVFRSADENALFGVELNTAACARPDDLCIEECIALVLAVLRENSNISVKSVS